LGAAEAGAQEDKNVIKNGWIKEKGWQMRIRVI